jgi:hypothetical protein
LAWRYPMRLESLNPRISLSQIRQSVKIARVCAFLEPARVIVRKHSWRSDTLVHWDGCRLGQWLHVATPSQRAREKGHPVKRYLAVSKLLRHNMQK